MKENDCDIWLDLVKIVLDQILLEIVIEAFLYWQFLKKELVGQPYSCIVKYYEKKNKKKQWISFFFVVIQRRQCEMCYHSHSQTIH